MKFPTIPEEALLERLQPASGRVRMVLDTDAYNEIDDQFAIIHALLSPKHLSVEAIYAAPFSNRRACDSAEGMEKSYQEILKILFLLGLAFENFAFRGSPRYLEDLEDPVQSDASSDLVERAMKSRDDPLYVVAIGAITNVASAILMEPEIISRIVVVWLGGHGLHWPDTREFNLMQDPVASRLIFDCGVPLVHIPCLGVASHLITSLAEIERYVAGRGTVGDYLAEIFRTFSSDHYARSKVLWDISTVGYLIHHEWVPTQIVPSPVLTDQLTWEKNQNRHPVRSALYVRRDEIYRDLFTKLESWRSKS